MMDAEPQTSLLFEIPFDKEIYQRQTDLKFSKAWNKVLRKNKSRFFVSLGIFLWGAIIIYGKSNLGFIFVIIGIYGFLDVFKINKAYRRNKIQFGKAVDNLGQQYLNASKGSVWGFLEDTFVYQDTISDVKIKWDGFESFSLIGDDLFLNLKSGQSYILGKDEVRAENFSKIVLLLESKMNKAKM